MSRKSIEGRLRRDAYGATTPPLETPHQSMALTKHACVLWGVNCARNMELVFIFKVTKELCLKRKSTLEEINHGVYS